MTETAKKNFQLTGWHVLLGVILFFVVISLVNARMIYLAVTSFPGEQQKKSYMQGLQYNEVLEEKKIQEALGWRLTVVDGARLSPSQNTIRLEMVDRTDAPLTGLAFQAMLVRPATDESDRSIQFVEEKEGTYISVLGDRELMQKGAWDLKIKIMSEDESSFTAEKRLWLE